MGIDETNRPRDGEPLLRIEHLSVAFDTDEGTLGAVDDVSFSIDRGEVVGLVGESGCGKSVTALSMVRLIPSPPGRIASGSIHFNGRDLLALPIAELRRVRGREIGMIFQDPMTSLSPLHRIGDQLVEALRLHRDIDRRGALRIAADWLRRVGIPDPEDRLFAYPYQFSGGMRQRAMIAIALLHDPALLIADEPTTALDVTVQAQVFDAMMKARRPDTSVLLITHDLGVVWERCQRVIVMYAGRIAEEAPTEELFRDPRHPYTRGLLQSIPARQKRGERLSTIPGQVPSPLDYPAGCRFSDRCPNVFDRCRAEEPPLYELGNGRRSACFLCEVNANGGLRSRTGEPRPGPRASAQPGSPRS